MNESIFVSVEALQVGQRVTYTGDMANAPGQGAVMSIKPVTYTGHAYSMPGSHVLPGYCARVILSDGRELQDVRGIATHRTGGQRVILAHGIAGPDELVQLVGAAATLKASRQAAADLAQRAHDEVRAALPGQHPHLTPGATAAQNIRAALKHSFPGVRFSVRTDGNAVNVRWTDGPTDADVSPIVDRFQQGHFDGMTDCYEYSRSPFCETFGGAKYTFTCRDYSPAFLGACLAAALDELGTPPPDRPDIPAVTAPNAWQTAHGAGRPSVDHWHGRRVDTWRDLAHAQAHHTSGPQPAPARPRTRTAATA